MYIYEFHMILGINTNFLPIYCNACKFHRCEAGTENTDQMW